MRFLRRPDLVEALGVLLLCFWELLRFSRPELRLF